MDPKSWVDFFEVERKPRNLYIELFWDQSTSYLPITGRDLPTFPENGVLHGSAQKPSYDLHSPTRTLHLGLFGLCGTW